MKKIVVIFILMFLFSFTASAKTKKKYLALGDSITEGYALDNPSEERFAKLFSDKFDLELTNEAKTGDTSFDLLDKLANYNIYDYDVITLCVGANDVFSNFTVHFEGKSGFELATVVDNLLKDEEFNKDIEEDIKKLEANYPKIMEIIKKGHAQIYLMNVYNPYRKCGLEKLDELADGYVKQINEIISKNKSGTTFINLYKNFENEKNVINSQKIQMDKFFDPHPNAKGHEAIFNYLSIEYEKNNPYLINIIIAIVALILVIIFETVEVIFTFKKFTIKNVNNDDIKPKLEDNKKEEKTSSRFIRS